MSPEREYERRSGPLGIREKVNLGWALLAHKSAFASDGTTPILDGLSSVAQ